MPTLPPLPPSWDGFHPLVVHFPLGLLLVAPLFVLIGAVTGARSFMVAALIMLTLGSIAAFVATNTGEAAYDAYEPDEASELIDPDYEYSDVMDKHGESAETARNVFSAITAVYAVWVMLAYLKPSTMKLLPRMLGGLVFVVAIAWAALLLAEAAHYGGELVHEYGVRATISSPEGDEEDVE